MAVIEKKVLDNTATNGGGFCFCLSFSEMHPLSSRLLFDIRANTTKVSCIAHLAVEKKTAMKRLLISFSHVFCSGLHGLSSFSFSCLLTAFHTLGGCVDDVVLRVGWWFARLVYE